MKIWMNIISFLTDVSDIDECLSDPCVHGNCTDLVNGYKCTCEDWYGGTNCRLSMLLVFLRCACFVYLLYCFVLCTFLW